MSGEVYSTPVSYVGAITPVPVDLARIILLAAAIAGLDLVPFAQLVRRRPVRVAAAAAERRDEARLDPSLVLAVVICVIKPSSTNHRKTTARYLLMLESGVVSMPQKSKAPQKTPRHTSDVERAVRVDPRDLTRVFLASAAIPGLYARTNAHSAPRRTAAPRTTPTPAAPALLSDQALRDARLTLSVVVVNIVGVVPAVPRDFARVELPPAPIVGFYLVTLTESIASAVGIAVPAAERRDEAGFDSRLTLAVIICVWTNR